jgi:hypothetical protein
MPTVSKDKPIYLTDIGKEILSIIQKQGTEFVKYKSKSVTHKEKL